MRKALLSLLMLAALAGCTPARQAPPMAAVPLVNDPAGRPLRQAYALKAIEFIKSDDEMSQEIGETLKKELPVFLKNYSANDKEKWSELYLRVIIPEAQRRVAEIKEIFAGVFADLLTTDELRRMSEGVAHPAFARFRAKQPLTERDKQELAPLKFPELAKRLDEIKTTGIELARIRSELWGKAMVEDLYRRKPELFQEKTI